jgi:hypothetical protein
MIEEVIEEEESCCLDKPPQKKAHLDISLMEAMRSDKEEKEKNIH